MGILQNTLLVISVVLLTWAVWRGKNIFVKKMDQKREEGKAVPDFFVIQVVEKIFTVLILFISLMLILQIFGLNIMPLLTFSGIGAAILAFASKDIVANFFGGLMIYITRPFSIREEIEIPSKNIIGKVEEIGWYLTTLRSLQKKSIYVPNATFSTELIFNNSRLTHRKIDEKIRFRLSEPDEAAQLILKARSILQRHPDIDQKEEIDVFLLSISPYGTVIEVKAYVKTTKYPKFMAVKQEILLTIYAAAKNPMECSRDNSQLVPHGSEEHPSC